MSKSWIAALGTLWFISLVGARVARAEESKYELTLSKQVYRPGESIKFEFRVHDYPYRGYYFELGDFRIGQKYVSSRFRGRAAFFIHGPAGNIINRTHTVKEMAGAAFYDWDQCNPSGKQVPEGKYAIRVNVYDRSGKFLVSRKKVFWILDTSALTLSAKPMNDSSVIIQIHNGTGFPVKIGAVHVKADLKYWSYSRSAPTVTLNTRMTPVSLPAGPTSAFFVWETSQSMAANYVVSVQILLDGVTFTKEMAFELQK